MLCISVFGEPQGCPKQPHHHTHGHPQHTAREAEARKELTRDAGLSTGLSKTLSPPWFANQIGTTPCAPGGRVNKPALCYREKEKRFSPTPAGSSVLSPSAPLWNQMQDVSKWEGSKYEVQFGRRQLKKLNHPQRTPRAMSQRDDGIWSIMSLWEVVPVHPSHPN